MTVTDTSSTATVSAPDAAAPAVQWAPAEPRPKRARWGLRIGVPAGVVGVVAVAASLVLIAPGTAVAGVPVGFLTAGAASDAIAQRLATTTVTLGEGGPTLTGAQLGAIVDSGTLAGQAYHDRPLWNVSQWFGDTADAEIAVDATTAMAALQAAAPDLFTAPVSAEVSFTGSAYELTPAVDGEGVDVAVVAEALQDAFSSGTADVVVDPVLVPVEPVSTTAEAQEAVDRLNAMLGDIGFYVGAERTVPVSPAEAASWLSIGTDESGAFTIAADPAKIQVAVDALDIDQEVVDGTVVVNAAGDVLRDIVAGQDGRVLGDTSGVAAAFAAQLAEGSAAFELPVTVTPQKTTELERLLEVDLSRQRLYLKENGKVVDTWLISSGRPGAVTYPGHFSIGWKTASQDMQGTARDSGKKYTQEDVPWVMYFNGNQAFHGAYWHNNFGNVMSAGCVNMPPAKAKMIYDWSPVGVDVWIHA
ncbi:L,D-transpeptidase [Microbacterium sp. T2.11-28]|uniref:L,D-transpeptidase n=1 Tax=Microbacterium sp. T2.11-28 TaxID=3041169 RepID=UPI0025424D7C|nr:L,D-transpeptidase [Microbacterium sp. T2.11-28]